MVSISSFNTSVCTTIREAVGKVCCDRDAGPSGTFVRVAGFSTRLGNSEVAVAGAVVEGVAVSEVLEVLVGV